MTAHVLFTVAGWAAALVCGLMTWACWELAGEALAEQQARAAAARYRLSPPPARRLGAPASYRTCGAAFFLTALALILVAQ